MDRAPTPFPSALRSTPLDPLERELVEVDAAIALVLEGVARRVRLANLTRPDTAAAHAAAAAGGLPIRVRLELNARTLCVDTPDA
jgi:hypothetical protein